MDPKIWGPSTWLFLHTVTFNYPKEPTIIDRNNYHDFFTSLQNVLPCPTCQKHYMMHLSKYPIQLQSRKHLVVWLLKVHNAVNIKNGKEPWTYDELYDKYNSLYSNGSSKFKLPEKWGSYLVVILLMIVIVCAYLYSNHKKSSESIFY